MKKELSTCMCLKYWLFHLKCSLGKGAVFFEVIESATLRSGDDVALHSARTRAEQSRYSRFRGKLVMDGRNEQSDGMKASGNQQLNCRLILSKVINKLLASRGLSLFMDSFMESVGSWTRYYETYRNSTTPASHRVLSNSNQSDHSFIDHRFINAS